MCEEICRNCLWKNQCKIRDKYIGILYELPMAKVHGVEQQDKDAMEKILGVYCGKFKPE